MKSIIYLLVAILFFSACSSGVEPSQVPAISAEQAITETHAPATNLRANGILHPIQQMALSFGTDGFIKNVGVGVGESVRAGQVLVRLDRTEAALALQQAEAQLAATQANYDLVAAGNPAERLAAISSARLALIAVQQSLAALHNDADLVAAQALQSVVDAQKAVADARRGLDNMTSTASQASIDAAYANMILAKASLDKAQDDYEPWKNKPENNTTRATMLSKLAQAQQVYDAAVRQYNGYIGSTNDLDLAQAEAVLTLVQTELLDAQETNEILQNGPDPDEVKLAEAQVANAQAHLSLAKNYGPTTEELAAAQAQVDAARTYLEILQAQVDKMIITAPFDGVLAAVPANPGEWASPGETMIEILDTSGWTIETKNVGELQIGQIVIGQEVMIWVNAFKDELLTGRVKTIAPVAVVQQGDTTYTLTIELPATDLNLWSGMTAQVEIQTEITP